MNSIRSLFGKSGGGGGGGAGSSGSTLGGGIGKPDPQVAINKLKENLEMLDKREKFLQQKADEQTKIAKTLATKNKSGKESQPIGRWINLLLGILPSASSLI